MEFINPDMDDYEDAIIELMGKGMTEAEAIDKIVSDAEYAYDDYVDRRIEIDRDLELSN